jgi:hypothetical protein
VIGLAGTPAELAFAALRRDCNGLMLGGTGRERRFAATETELVFCRGSRTIAAEHDQSARRRAFETHQALSGLI